MVFGGIQAQTMPQTPKLVVTLTIDQLRTDYLEKFAPLYGESGFKRLMREGLIYTNAEYSFDGADRASGIATIFSGATPSLNGIISENWLDAKSLRPINCVDDPEFMGNYTAESSSPSKLLTSTLADEIKIATENKGLVYAIAPFRDAAILSAGHNANSALWINELTGKWCSTTYYGDFPWWVSQYNERWSPDYRIKDIEWSPIYPAERYTYLPNWRQDSFKHRFENERVNKFRRLITSPLVNDEINLLVEELLEKSTIADDQLTDLLALTYYAGNYNHLPTQECAMELQDTYARLDRSLGRLLDMLDSKVGLQNILLCIVSTGYTEPDAPDVGLYRTPGGEFHLTRCVTLLNMYLMATYGQGQYVEAYYDNQIYLNEKLIEDKQLDFIDIQEKAEAFLMQFSGVDEVYSGHRLLLGNWSPRLERIRNAYHRLRSGDLIINVLPGWTVIDEKTNNNNVVRTAKIPSPIILLGHNIKAEKITTPVNLEQVAPTLANQLRIRAPNGTKATSLF